MSGLAIALMLAMPQTSPAAVDPAALVAHYHDMTTVTPSQAASCGTANGTDITICGKRHSDQRLPLRDERGPSSNPQPAGEANADCVARTGAACPVCPPGGCTGVNLLAAPFKLFHIVRAIVDPDR